MKLPLLISLGLMTAAVACGPPPKAPQDAGELPADGGEDAGVDAGVPVLGPEVGTGDHSSASISLTPIASAAQGLRRPRDLAFNPRRPDELWIVNDGDESVTIVFDASTPTRTSERRKDGYALHFMANPAALAFGADETTIGKPGTFATCGESRNTYDDTSAPNDFMGATLWSSDLSVFAVQNPNGLGSHLDMLHNSPLCMGIAHEKANVYWAFDGLSGAIVRYDFETDNGVGNDDHSDGTAYEYVTGKLKYEAGVPSHLAFDEKTGMLFIADTGNFRVMKLDTTSGTQGQALQPLEPMKAYYRMNDAVLSDVIPESTGLLSLPSGLELHNDLLYVSDNSNGRISVFTLDGERVNWVDTGLPAGALAGLAFGPDGKVYVVDMIDDMVFRIDPP